MNAWEWREAPLGKGHDRDVFDCGDDELNVYLKRYARQNHDRNGAKCFVAAPLEAPARILGYYTLSPASLEFARTSAVAKKGLGRYEVPVFRLGWLAVDQAVQRRGLGAALVWRAAARCIRVAQEVDGVALLIDAKSELAAHWCESFGALRLSDAPLSLILRLEDAAAAWAESEPQ
ncbi:MAG: GNAT family N-acetyltransferase [Pseudomonadota bacterium]|nr:GNAT family N-acetyltransferase [Pseudomonadota bacterium]